MIGNGFLQAASELVELKIAPDHRSLGGSGDSTGSGSYAHQSPGVKRVRLSLHHQGFGRLSLDRVANELEGRLAYQDLGGRGVLLEASCNIDAVAGDVAV